MNVMYIKYIVGMNIHGVKYIVIYIVKMNSHKDKIHSKNEYS